MIARRQMTALAASLLLPGLIAACVSAQKYDNLGYYPGHPVK